MPSGTEHIVFPTKASIEKDWDDFVKSHHIHDPGAYLDAVEMPATCISSLQIGVSTVCNLNCPMCFNHFERDYAYYSNRELSLAEVERLVKQNAPMKNLTFSVSGEPFLYKQIFQILAMARPHVEGFSFSTNALLLDEEKVARLKDFPIDAIYVSADGSDRISYETFRKNGKYDLFYRNVRLLTDAFGDKVVIAATVFRENQQSLLAMPKFCAALGVKHLIVFRLFEHPKAVEKCIHRLNRDEMVPFMVGFLAACDAHGITPHWDTRAVDHRTAKFIDESTCGKYSWDLEVYQRPCAMPFHNILIDPEGNYNFCCAIEPIPKNALKTPARQLFNTPEIKMMRVLNLLGRFPHVCRKYCGRIANNDIDISLDNLKKLIKKQKFESMDWKGVDRVSSCSKIIVAPFGSMTRELLSDGFFVGSEVVAVADKAYEKLSIDGMDLPVIGYEALFDISCDAYVITSGAYWQEILALITEQNGWHTKTIYRIDNIERKLRRLLVNETIAE